MNDIAQPAPNELNRVFAAAIAREDQWRQLNAYARAWADAKADSNVREDMRGRCRSLLAYITRLEHCWAYPGARLLDALRDALDGGDGAAFARLAQKASGALQSGDFRREESAWDSNADGDARVIDAMPPDIDGGIGKPYFEVLVVTPSEPGQWQRAADEVRRMRRPEDQFQYVPVHVGSFE